jgi:TetR/AcrR family transcriptional regulator, cholesterol catabolism regulator
LAHRRAEGATVLDARADDQADPPSGDSGVVATHGRFAVDPRDAVLSAAAELFDEVGYHNVTIGSIAERAGTTKATVLDLFRVQHDILHAIHDVWMDELLAMAARHDYAEDAACDAVRAYVRDVLTVIDNHPSHVRVYFEYYRDLPPDLQKLAKAKRDTYEAQVERVIRRGIETGMFRAQNVRVAAFGLFGMCNWAYHWYRPGGALSVHQIATQFGDLFLRGLCTRPDDANED